MRRRKKQQDDFTPVEVRDNYQVPEEFPEGTYGNPINADEPLHAMPEKESKRHHSAFAYENKELHADLPRQFPDAHDPQDYPDEEGITHPEKK
ncbi:hypothetical protein [Tenuibacillus multivorans]|uniref:Cytosolic protein n=1 Tax=Tenuibacillus multivorans TaxID=237069 RepID=A0A1H0FTZ8_9BACI|nr:hypothetical protein [Tenuibacillus multivorans]GEL77882.1 hypothetical protein TMU01_21170 [Tenuibacillus multivorans]SDN98054.1 hypothetical protein SAMN05216498_0365 [Tenuibacillus multivorans]